MKAVKSKILSKIINLKNKYLIIILNNLEKNLIIWMINLEINLMIYVIIMKSFNKIKLMKLKNQKMKRMRIIMRCFQFLATIKNKMKIFSKIKRKWIILKIAQILTFRKNNHFLNMMMKASRMNIIKLIKILKFRRIMK